MFKDKKMKNTKNDVILLPTDFSEAAQSAVEHAASVSSKMDYRIVLVHVMNKATEKYLEGATKVDVEQRLEEISKEITEKYGTEVEFLIKKGDLFDGIKEAADSINPKLIMLGTHGKKGMQKLTGSYVLKIIEITNTPTIIVQKKHYPNGYKNIVFPITTSTQDRQKLSWAIAIAKLFEAKIHLMPKFESEKTNKNRIMAITKQIKNILEENGIKFEDKVSDPAEGNFADQVIDYAVQNDAELIMTMVNKEKNLFFSSWDEKLIYNAAEIPVICINPIEIRKTWAGY